MKGKILVGGLAIALALATIIWVLSRPEALITHPKGIIAHSELRLITINVILMLAIIVPTAVWLMVTALRYRAENKKPYDPNNTTSRLTQVMLWVIPSLVVLVMAVITWEATHRLDPYRPLEGEAMTIQVLALDWKWLFIYPEEGIATVNYLQFPAKIPIHFALAADGSPMNSFWIPSLSGQIYAMTGMVTPLYIMADGNGEYSGKAAEINGDGYAGMRFLARSTTQKEFDSWVEEVKTSPLRLTEEVYNELLKPSWDNPVTLYSDVEKGLFMNVVMKYMHPHG